jgi:general secretion pathway protein D
MPTAQVLIEARIVEVSSDAMDRFGVRWSPNGSEAFTAEDYDDSIIGKGRMNYLQGFGGMTDVTDTDRGGVTSLRSGLLDVSVNLDVLIQFLKKNTDASVLAEPQISVEDNETGKLFVGSQVPFIYQSQNTEAGSLNQSFTYKDVGIILEVIPHINVTGDVLLRIRVESSTIVPGETILGGAVIDARTFRTDMTAKSGETIVLGGIIQKQFSETIRKVPLLGDIPGLGWAFKKKDKTAREVELFVFLRPRVIRTAADALREEAEIQAKTPLIQDWLRQSGRGKLTNAVEQPNPPAP